MTTLREAAQAALTALQTLKARGVWGDFDGVADALKAALVEDAMQRFTDVNQEIEAALAEDVVTHGSAWSKDGKRIDPKSVYAEPVQDGCDHCNHPMYAAIKCRVCGRVTSEHLTPGSEHLGSEQMAEPVQNTQRKPLSEEQALDIARTFGAQPWPPGSCVAFARAIERAHGIKE